MNWERNFHSDENNSLANLPERVSDALALHNLNPSRSDDVSTQMEEVRAELRSSSHEHQAWLKTLDAITSQASELLAEKRILTGRMNELEAAILQLKEETDQHRISAEVSARLVSELDKRANEEREVFRIAARQLEISQQGLISQLEILRQASIADAAEIVALRERATIAERECDISKAQLAQLKIAKLDSEREFATLAIELDRSRLVVEQLLSEKDAFQLLSVQQTNEKVELESRLCRAEDECNVARSKLAQIDQTNSTLETELAAATEYRTRTQLLLQNLNDKLYSLKSESDGLKADLNARIAHEYLLKEQLVTTQNACFNAITRFDAAFSDLLTTIRSQRAWRIMVLIRKAYTLSVRKHGNFLSALKVPLELLPGRKTNLDLYDIRFPNIWDFVPEPISPPSGAIEAPSGLPQSARYDIIVLPIFDFEFRFQRPQQIAGRFARLGHRIFWVSPSRFQEEKQIAGPETVPLRENIWEVRLGGPKLNIYTDDLSDQVADRLSESLAQLYRHHNIGAAVVYVQFPFWRKIGLNLKTRFGALVAYDCMDDWRNWTADPRISTFALGEENQLAREADLVLATSAELHNRLQQQSVRPVLRLRNGADFQFFRTSEHTDSLAHMPRPIVGYYGALADWVNIELMVDVAKNRPDYSFVVIGEVHNADVSSLKRLPNVHLLGEKPYRMLPSYLSLFDVCILPFALNPLTRAVDPVKVYEYLSQGKPVVATPLPEVCDHKEVVYLAKTAGEFASAIDLAVREDDRERQAARISYAEANSWARRVDAFHESVCEKFPLVSILIVSHESREFLKACLDSVRKNTAHPNYELVIVDNASKDGSDAILQEYADLDTRTRFLRLQTNHGFAGGNNIAAREARGEFLVFLNADTIVTWGWLERLIRPFGSDTAIGMTAPVTNFSGNETRIETSYSNVAEMQDFAEQLVKNEFGRLQQLPMIPLLCAVVSRAAWQRVGELDESFGLGMFEDDDFSLRMKRAGYKLVGVEDCFVHHFGNGSFAKLPRDQALAIFERNRSYFEQKWGVAWTPHKTRLGVQPATDRERISPAQFLLGNRIVVEDERKVKLLKLHPDHVPINGSVNLQPDGSSALVVACEHATPGTSIRCNDTLLQTTYGNSRLLSAILPADFSRRAERIIVTLVNDFGESNPLVFTVGDQA